MRSNLSYIKKNKENNVGNFVILCVNIEKIERVHGDNWGIFDCARSCR